MSKTATGVDIGRSTARALRGRFKNNTFEVDGLVVAGVDGGNLEGAELVAKGWDALTEELPFKLGRARVGLSGKDVNVRYTRVPRLPDWQLRNLMRFEVAEIGDQSGSEVASDFNLLPEIPEVEGEDVVLLAMAREARLEDGPRASRRRVASSTASAPLPSLSTTRGSAMESSRTTRSSLPTSATTTSTSSSPADLTCSSRGTSREAGGSSTRPSPSGSPSRPLRRASSRKMPPRSGPERAIRRPTTNVRAGPARQPQGSSSPCSSPQSCSARARSRSRA